MDYNQIDLQPMKSGWGMVWQGNHVDGDIYKIPGPLLIVCMDRGEDNNQWIDHKTVHGVLTVWIEDEPGAALPDPVFLGLVESGLAALKQGLNLYVHCTAGCSRASYYNVALHCCALGIGVDESLSLVRSRRACANPNSGFMAQLKRLEPILRRALDRD